MTFKQELDEFFGPVLRAVSIQDDFDVFAVYLDNPLSTDEHPIGALHDDTGHNFYLDITSVDKGPDSWTIYTPIRDWQFRKMDPADVESYSAYMKGFGFDV